MIAASFSAVAAELQTDDKKAVLFAAPVAGHPEQQNILFCLQDKCERIGSDAGYTTKEFAWMQDRCEGLSASWRSNLLDLALGGLGYLVASWPGSIAGSAVGEGLQYLLAPGESRDAYEISATYLNTLDVQTARFTIPYNKLIKIQKGVRSCAEMYEVYKKSDPIFKRQMDRGIWVPFG